MAASNVRQNVERALREQSDELKAGHVQKFNEIDARLADIQDALTARINSRMNKKGFPAYIFRDSEDSPDPFSPEAHGSLPVSTPWIFLRLVINERTRLRRFAADYQMAEFGFENKNLYIGLDRLGRKVGAPAVGQWIAEESDFNARPAQMPEIEIGQSNLQQHVDFRIQLKSVLYRLVVDVKPHFLKGPGGGKHAKTPVSDTEILRRLRTAAAETEDVWEASSEEVKRIRLDMEKVAFEKPAAIRPHDAMMMGFDDETYKALKELWEPFAEDLQAIREIYGEGINFFISEVEVDLALALIEGNGGVADRLTDVRPDDQISALQETGKELITRSSHGEPLGWETASRHATQEVRYHLFKMDNPIDPPSQAVGL